MNELLARRLITMAEMDQTVRQLALSGAGNNNVPNYLIYAVDLGHGASLKEIIRESGYPSVTSVGESALHAFWLLVQHQDFDLAFQEACLMNIEFDKKDHAYLTDRVRVQKGLKQLYGTQFDKPIEDEGNVDERRASMGLEPLTDYLKKRFS